MRCLNCGYPNADGAMVCAKCGKPFNISSPTPQPAFSQPMGQPMQQPMGQPMGQPMAQQMGQSMQQPMGQPMPRQTMVQSAMQQPVPQSRPTVVDPTGQLAQMQGAQMPRAAQSTSCSACGYPIVGNIPVCPNCGKPVSMQPAQPAYQPQQAPQPMVQPVQQAPQSAPQPAPKPAPGFDPNMTIVCEKCGGEMSLANKFCPHCGERVHLSTIGPNTFRKKSGPKCSLTLMPEEGEDVEAKKNEYEGNSIILNRNNTEQNNRTITSREQAELICKDGKWFILNKSEYGSTYVMAKREIELQPGDVVILGDRCFKFEATAEK